jgi:arylsulfatase A-like enzyme
MARRHNQQRGRWRKEQVKQTRWTFGRLLVLSMALGLTWLQPVLAQGAPSGKKPNILVIWGDDIGTWNISANNRGMMGYRTPNIDRIATEGLSFTDYYGQQSCTAGRAAFLNGSVPVRTGMTKVGVPGSPVGWKQSDITIATVLRAEGYATGQFGKNHQGDRDEQLPTANGFDEFFGNLYHLNAEEEPENVDYPKNDPWTKVNGPRGVIHSWADGKGGQKIENTGPLTRKQWDGRPRPQRHQRAKVEV